MWTHQYGVTHRQSNVQDAAASLAAATLAAASIPVATTIRHDLQRRNRQEQHVKQQRVEDTVGRLPADGEHQTKYQHPVNPRSIINHHTTPLDHKRSREDAAAAAAAASHTAAAAVHVAVLTTRQHLQPQERHQGVSQEQQQHAVWTKIAPSVAATATISTTASSNEHHKLPARENTVGGMSENDEHQIKHHHQHHSFGTNHHVTPADDTHNCESTAAALHAAALHAAAAAAHVAWLGTQEELHCILKKVAPPATTTTTTILEKWVSSYHELSERQNVAAATTTTTATAGPTTTPTKPVAQPMLHGSTHDEHRSTGTRDVNNSTSNFHGRQPSNYNTTHRNDVDGTKKNETEEKKGHKLQSDFSNDTKKSTFKHAHEDPLPHGRSNLLSRHSRQDVEKDAASTELAVKATEWCIDSDAARLKYGNIEDWDVSAVTSFKNLFCGFGSIGCTEECQTFNADLIAWDTSNVVDMSWMFSRADAFNGNIDSWDTSNVKDMSGMFYSAESFNGNIDSWDTSNVEDMSTMFHFAKSFNGDLDSWHTSNVEDMSGMFNSASAFNGNLDSWNTSNVDDMSSMFNFAKSFNGDLNSWHTSNVVDMHAMFQGAESFNQDLGRWRFSPDPLPITTKMFARASKVNCTFQPPGNYSQTQDRTPTARIYCNLNENLLRDGSNCKTNEECDTGSCSTKNQRCLGYAAADKQCSVATNSGGCFVAPTTTSSWSTFIASTHQDFPAQMVGNGTQSTVIKWNWNPVLNKRPAFDSTNMLTKDGKPLVTELTYKLKWLTQEAAKATPFQIGETVPLSSSDDTSIWDPDDGPGGVGLGLGNPNPNPNPDIDCPSSADIYATPERNGTYVAWLIAVDARGPAMTAGVPPEFDEVLIKQWNLTVTEVTHFTVTSFDRRHESHKVNLELPTPMDCAFNEECFIARVDQGSLAPQPTPDGKITYTVQVDNEDGADCEFALLINPDTGFMSGKYNVEKSMTRNQNTTCTATLSAVETVNKTNGNLPSQTVKLETFEILFHPDDTALSVNGPGNKICAHGKTVDVVKFDSKFICDCSESGYEDDNCSTSIAEKYVKIIIGIICGCILISCVAWKFRQHQVAENDAKAALARARKAYGLSEDVPTIAQSEDDTNSDVAVSTVANPSFIGLTIVGSCDLESETDDGVVSDRYMQVAATDVNAAYMQVAATVTTAEAANVPPATSNTESNAHGQLSDNNINSTHLNMQHVAASSAIANDNGSVNNTSGNGSRSSDYSGGLASSFKSYPQQAEESDYSQGFVTSSPPLPSVDDALNKMPALNVFMLDPAAGYHNDLLTYEDDSDSDYSQGLVPSSALPSDADAVNMQPVLKAEAAAVSAPIMPPIPGGGDDATDNQDDEDDDDGDYDKPDAIHAIVNDDANTIVAVKKKQRRKKLAKFIAPTISLGKSTLAAKGLDVLLGIDPKTYMHVKNKMKVVLKEFAKSGTDEDNMNLKMLLDGSYLAHGRGPDFCKITSVLRHLQFKTASGLQFPGTL
eukprot:gene3474-22403_t